VEYNGTQSNIPGINPVTSVTSLSDSIEVCAEQGTNCKGLNYGVFDGSSKPQAVLKRDMTTSNPRAGINSAIRTTGPSGARSRLLQNGDFSSGSLDPWISTTSQNGARFAVADGKA
jgi:hypothetical protein